MYITKLNAIKNAQFSLIAKKDYTIMHRNIHNHNHVSLQASMVQIHTI